LYQLYRSISSTLNLAFRRLRSASIHLTSFISMQRLKELRRRLISARTAAGSNASETRNPSQSIRTRVIARYGVDWYSRTNAASPPGYTATRFAKTAFVGGTVRPRSTRPAWAWFKNAAAAPGFGRAGGGAVGSALLSQ